MTPHTPLAEEATRRPEGRIKNRSPELAARRAAWSESQSRLQRSTIYDWASFSAAPAVQLRAFDTSCTDLHDAIAVGNHEVWGDPLPAHLPGGAVQLRARMAQHRKDESEQASRDPHAIAAAGLNGGGGGLPHLGAIQRAFGRHDISGVKAHVGGAASAAAAELGAEAYTSGDRIAFASSPDLFLAAHEAAHVVQQRAGVSLPGGMGKVGDRYERHADEVAAQVVANGSAESLLDTMVGGGTGQAVQFQAIPLSGADAGGRNTEPSYTERNAENHERRRLEAEAKKKGKNTELGALGQAGTRRIEFVDVAVSGTFPKAVGPADLTLKGHCKYEAALVTQGEGSSETELEAEIEVNLEMGVGSLLKLYVGGTGRLRIWLPGAVLAGDLGPGAMSQVVASAASRAVKECLERDGNAILKRLTTLHAQAEAGWSGAIAAYRTELAKAMNLANKGEGFGDFEADPVIAQFVGVSRAFTKGILDLRAAKSTRDAGGLPSGHSELLRPFCSVDGVMGQLGIPAAGPLSKQQLGLLLNEAWQPGSAAESLRQTLAERAQGLSLPSMAVADAPRFTGDLGFQVGFSAELGNAKAEGKAQALLRVETANREPASADGARGSSVDLSLGTRVIASVSVPVGNRTVMILGEYSRFAAPGGAESKAVHEVKVVTSISVEASAPPAEIAQAVGQGARAAIGGSAAALTSGKPSAGALQAICAAFGRNLPANPVASDSAILEVEFSYDFKDTLTVKTITKVGQSVESELASAGVEMGSGYETTFKLPRKGHSKSE